MGEVAEQFIGGGTPNTNIEQYWNGDIPWFQSSDLSEDDILNITKRKFITNLGLSNSAAKLIPKNSIAIVTRVGVGKVALVPFEFSTSQDFLSLSNLNINPQFATYLIFNLMRSEANAVQGTSIKGITKNVLLDKNLIIPKLEQEQQKIGTFFTALDRYITIHQRK